MRSYKDIPEIAEIVQKHQLYLKNKRKFQQYKAHFQGVDLTDVVFNNIDLRFADFSNCDCSTVVFYCCNLTWANFVGTNVNGMKHRCCAFNYIPDIYVNIPCPCYVNGCRNLIDSNTNYDIIKSSQNIQGELIGYKIVRVNLEVDIGGNICWWDCKYALAILRIPADSKRIIFEGGKCRCKRAYVTDIVDKDDVHYEIARPYIQHRSDLIYTVGQEVIADGWTENASIECGHGIHFFLTENEAWGYIQQ